MRKAWKRHSSMSSLWNNKDWEVSRQEPVEFGEHKYSGASVDTMMMLSPAELSFLRLTQD